MSDNVAQTLVCPSNTKTSGQFWNRKGTFGWKADKTMDVKCIQPPQSGRTPLPSRPSLNLSDDYLSRQGCSCSSTAAINVTSTDSKTLKKHKTELGLYIFKDGQVHEGKPYYIHQDRAVKRFMFFNKPKKSWWVSATLGGNPVIKMEDKADTNCPENTTPKKWMRKNAFSVWSKDSTLKLTCMQPPSSTLSPSRPTSRPSLNPSNSRQGCSCSNTSAVNATSTDSRTMKKHKTDLGLYTFEDGQVHEGKPYYIHQAGAVKRFMFFNKPKKSWWISATLGGNPVIKMEDKADTNCPENTSPKKWMRKNALGFWSKDPSLKLTCAAAPNSGTSSYGTRRPSYPTGRPHTDTSLLSTSGCQCTKAKVKVSSTDSRTKSKHFEVMGLFEFKGKLHNGKPYYERKVQAKVYFLFFDVSHKAWNIGDTLGGSTIKLKTEKNFDRACPADAIRSASSQKFWQRKNAVGIWGKDKTLKMECVDH